MKVLDAGHKYLLKCNGLKPDACSIELVFFKDPKIHEIGYDGTTIQEVLRACIDRVKFFDLNCSDNTMKITDDLLNHLRSALALLEKRHIDRWVQLGYLIEDIELNGANDHFIPNKSLYLKNTEKDTSHE